MFDNSDKFQAMIVQRKRNVKENHSLKVNNFEIESSTSVNLLGVEIDKDLNFEKHIKTLCRKASNQLNAIGRIHRYLGVQEKTLLINTFIYSNFNYCPLVWHFCSKAATKKIEKIQERCLRIIQNDYQSSYETLLQKSKTTTMEIKRLRTLAIEVYKTLNDLNPEFMKELFHNSELLNHRNHNLYVPHRNTVRFGDKSLRCLAPHIWNSLSETVKSATTLNQFKKLIKLWFGPECKCSLCSFNNQ